MSDKAVKSNKMKRQEKKAKRDRDLLLARSVKIPPKPAIFVQKVRNLPAAIEAVFNGQEFENYERKIKNVINAQHCHSNREFLKRIFLHFANLKIDFAECSTALNVLKRLACFEHKVIRPVEDWKPNTHNLTRQVFAFARHLYAKYEVPAFMDSCWEGTTVSKYVEWFILIGQGQNIRTMEGLPIPLTKKEAHYVMQSPKDLDIPQAIRYGQILNLGGDERFFRQVLRTRIAVEFSNNEFWESVFRWLLQNPMLDTAHYAPIMDFVHNQKFVPCRMENGNMVCAQPNLTMKGRDPESLLRQVEAWHKKIGKEGKGKFNNWAPSGIHGLHHKNDKDNIIYRIEEICNQKDLVTEGRTMRHCVGSYAGSCAMGRTSIWKFEEITSAGIEKRLTIEVDNKERSITQARGKYNKVATASDRYWLNLWARSAGLTLSRYLI